MILRFLTGLLALTTASTALPSRSPTLAQDRRADRAGVRRAHHGRKRHLRGSHLDRGQAARHHRVHRLRNHRLAPALVGKRAGDPQPRARALVRLRGRAVCREARRRGRRADRAHRQGGARRIRTPTPTRSGPDRTRTPSPPGSRARCPSSRSIFRRPRSARTTSAAACFARAPSGSGFQISLAGLLGVAASGVEGLEFNILSLNFGLGPSGLKLPLIGRIGSVRIDSALPAVQPAN